MVVIKAAEASARSHTLLTSPRLALLRARPSQGRNKWRAFLRIFSQVFNLYHDPWPNIALQVQLCLLSTLPPALTSGGHPSPPLLSPDQVPHNVPAPAFWPPVSSALGLRPTACAPELITVRQGSPMDMLMAAWAGDGRSMAFDYPSIHTLPNVHC